MSESFQSTLSGVSSAGLQLGVSWGLRRPGPKGRFYRFPKVLCVSSGRACGGHGSLVPPCGLLQVPGAGGLGLQVPLGTEQPSWKASSVARRPHQPNQALRNETSAAYIFLPSCFSPPLVFHLSLQVPDELCRGKETNSLEQGSFLMHSPLLPHHSSPSHTPAEGGRGWQWAVIKV